MLHYFFDGQTQKITVTDAGAEHVVTYEPGQELQILCPEGVRVLYTHKMFGHVTLENVTEIHFNYTTIFSDKRRVALESDIRHSGETLSLQDVVALWFRI